MGIRNKRERKLVKKVYGNSLKQHGFFRTKVFFQGVKDNFPKKDIDGRDVELAT